MTAIKVGAFVLCVLGYRAQDRNESAQNTSVAFLQWAERTRHTLGGLEGYSMPFQYRFVPLFLV